jgi:iron complex transport system ATP-binding protein
LLISAISVKLGDRLVLREVNVEFVRGLNVILGPNGSGKTTLLRCIIEMLKPQTGKIEVEAGEKSYAPAEYFGAEMSVLDVLLSGDSRREYTPYLELFSLQSFLERNFSSLSTGEKRMVLIAKALAEGDVVLMDEPTSGLDLKNQVKLREVLGTIKHKVIVVSTHDVSFAQAADRVALLKCGRVIAQGEAERVLTEDLLTQLYEVRVRRVHVDGKTLFLT